MAATSAIHEAPTAAEDATTVAARLTRPEILLLSVESVTVFSNRYAPRPKQVSCHLEIFFQVREWRVVHGVLVETVQSRDTQHRVTRDFNAAQRSLAL